MTAEAAANTQRARPEIYPRRLRLLHWITALLVAGQAGLAAINAAVYEGHPLLAETAVQAHLSLGLLILLLTLLRLSWRLRAVTPGLPGDLTGKARWAARGLHGALYALLLFLPVTGYVKLAALGFEIIAFGLIALPTLPLDPQTAAAARVLHGAGAALLAGLLVLHIGAAVFHRRLFGGPVIQRMWGPSGKS